MLAFLPLQITIMFKTSKQQGLTRGVFEQSSVSYFLTKSSDHLYLWKTDSEISTELLLVRKKPFLRKLLQLQCRDKAKWKTDFPCFWTDSNLLDMTQQVPSGSDSTFSSVLNLIFLIYSNHHVMLYTGSVSTITFCVNNLMFLSQKVWFNSLR